MQVEMRKGFQNRGPQLVSGLRAQVQALARIDGGRLTLRAYPGPLPFFLTDAVRWLAKRRPRAPAVHAQRD